MLAKIWSAAVRGIQAFPLEVEVDLSNKLPKFIIVGLPDEAVKEARDRVKTAMTNSGYDFPYKRIVINLAPGDMKKHGPLYDLPIAIGLMIASGQISPTKLKDVAVIGELSLDGTVRPVRGSLSMARFLRLSGFSGFIVPHENASEAAAAEGLSVYPVKNLAETVGFFSEERPICPYKIEKHELLSRTQEDLDYSEVFGQEHAKRAFLVAAAGGHNLIMVGPPGSGKTMLAKRLSTILPRLELEESIETTCIYSVAGILSTEDHGLIRERPFRSPHHTISDAGLAGGGGQPRPGEISLAHNGVLFLDELPEFNPRVLEVLREPLETGKITLTRARGSVTFPASFMLVAAMNPCPCGYFGKSSALCQCNAYQIGRYRNRISGPLLDRIDIHLELSAVDHHELLKARAGEGSENMRERVSVSRSIQSKRMSTKSGSMTNAHMPPSLISKYCKLDSSSEQLLSQAMQRFSLSARAYHKILKLARTIADLEEANNIRLEHVAEAISYRSLDRQSYV